MNRLSQINNDFAIMAVSLLQRNPVIMRPLSRIELEYSKYRQNLELEKSRGTFKIAADIGETASTAGSIAMSEIDQSNKNGDDENEKSLNRKLDRKLYLCLKESERNGHWSLPMSRFEFNPDSALHLHAQNHLSTLLSNSQNLELYHLGAAPVAFHMERFADRIAAPFGLKCFVFRSQLISGRIKLDSEKYPEYGWFCKEELESKLPKDFFDSIKDVISN